MKQFLKSTTALTLCVALSLPGGMVFAQGNDGCKGNAKNCAVEDGGKSAKKENKKKEAGKSAKKSDDAKGGGKKAEKQASKSEDAGGKKADKKDQAAKKAEKSDDAKADKKKRASSDAAEKRDAPAENTAEKQDQPRKRDGGDTKQAASSGDVKASEQTEAQAAQRTAAKQEADKTRNLSDADKAKLKKERREADKKRKRKAAAAAAAEDDSNAEVRREKFTERNTRRSDEDFRERLRDRREAARNDDDDDDDDGLSDLEKAMLLGLGALAVGSILNNGDEVVSTYDDRAIVDRDGQLYLLKDDNALLRQPGNEMQTETFSDGSTRTTVYQPDGSRVITIRDYDGTLLSRHLITPQGEAITLFDDTLGEREVITSQLPRARPSSGYVDATDEDALRRALEAAQAQDAGRSFSLRQVRQISAVRELAPEIELSSVRFATGSAAIEPRQAESLARIGAALNDLIEEDPRTVVLVEGHTDAVGDDAYNLALSDRRAESLALALSEYFDVPAENMIVQGYGESDLVVETEDAEQRNRRAVVRNITELLRPTDV